MKENHEYRALVSVCEQMNMTMLYMSRQLDELINLASIAITHQLPQQWPQYPTRQDLKYGDDERGKDDFKCQQALEKRMKLQEERAQKERRREKILSVCRPIGLILFGLLLGIINRHFG